MTITPKPVSKFKRLDKELVSRGLVASIERAKTLVMNGAVRVNGAPITAIHCPINPDHKIEISGIDCPWVSKDAIKLFETLKAIKLDVRGLTALNLGAGAGGFEDVLLQNGAKKIYAVERDMHKLDPSLSLNKRIKNLQRVEASSLNKDEIDKDFDLLIADIGHDNLIANITPALSLSMTGFYILIFIDDKNAAKDIEKFLRLEQRCLAKKVPEKLQKFLDEQGSYLIWMQKKA